MLGTQLTPEGEYASWAITCMPRHVSSINFPYLEMSRMQTALHVMHPFRR